ncbi:hypothetical protein MBLNU459_g8433t1 [Dothideomycetes sp. NU459]
MADEPRRSGRATKGQHKALEDSADGAPKPPTKKAATKKGAKKSSEPEPDDQEEVEEEVEDDGTIRCICGYTEDDIGNTTFVSCDACEVWQHNVCMGLPTDASLLPEHYMCEECQPDDHKETVAALAKGEKIWIDRKRAHEEELRRIRNEKKKGSRKSTGKGSRQSLARGKADLLSDAVSTSPAPAASSESGTKRKFEEESSQVPSLPEEATSRASPAPKAAPTPASASATETNSAPAEVEIKAPSPAAKRENKRRKSSAPPATKVQDKPDADTALVEIDQLPKERQGAATALSKIISDDVRERAKAGYRIPDGHTADSLGKYHASRIEYALFMNHSGPGQGHTPAYSQQFRAIHANFKKNPMLIERLLNSSLTADELSKMQSADMASEEAQKEREKLKEEVEKQSVMIQEDEKPRVRRTHKGDEYVDDEGRNGPEQSVFTNQPVRHRETDAELAAAAGSPSNAAEPGPAAASPDRMNIDHETAVPQQDRRASAQQFDINNVWAKTHQSPDAESAPQRIQQQVPRRRSSGVPQGQQEKGQKVDEDVDRLLAGDDNDDYEPTDLNTSDTSIVWRGQLVQPGVTELTANGRFVAGNDFGRYMPWSQFMPKTLEIEGRLEARKADDYLCGLQWSKKSDVAVLALTPYDNRQAFDRVFDYFATRKRYAVIQKGHGMSEIVKDVYVSPVDAGGKLPPHLELLEHNTLEMPLPERILVMTFVVNKPEHWNYPIEGGMPDASPAANVPAHLRNQSGPLASPINSQAPAPAYSPRPAQAFTPSHDGMNGQNGNYSYGGPNFLPPNPYVGPAPLTRTPPQYPPAQQPHPYPPPHYAPQASHPNPNVERILGPFVNAPAVAQILQAAGPAIDEHMLDKMRIILERDPAAGQDLAVFSGHLGTFGK